MVFCKGKGGTDHRREGIGEKPTAKANKSVAEVLQQKQLGQSTHKHWVTVHLEEAWMKIGKYMYPSINGTASARRQFKKELGDLPESTIQKY